MHPFRSNLRIIIPLLFSLLAPFNTQDTQDTAQVLRWHLSVSLFCLPNQVAEMMQLTYQTLEQITEVN